MTIYLRSLKPHCYAILRFCERGKPENQKNAKNVKNLRKNLQNTICLSYLCIGFRKSIRVFPIAHKDHLDTTSNPSRD